MKHVETGGIARVAVSHIKMPLHLNTCLRNNLQCMEWDVKRYQLNPTPLSTDAWLIAHH